MTTELIVASILLLPPALWVLSHGLFWCFCWCFCSVEDYFQDRFRQRIMSNMARLERISSESKAA